MKRPIVVVLALATFAASTIGAAAIVRTVTSRSETAPDEAAAVLFDAAGTPIDVPNAANDSGTATLTAADLTKGPTRVVPVLEPVAVGYDLAIGDMLADPPADASGTAGDDPFAVSPAVYRGAAVHPGERSDAIGDDTTEPAPPVATTPDEPTTTTADDTTDAPATGAAGDRFDPLLGRLIRIPTPRVDPCAGLTPGAPTPDDCPDGHAATYRGSVVTPPPALMFISEGHHLTAYGDGRACPSSTPAAGPGEVAVTVYTRTPLTELTLRLRPYGSGDAWVPLEAPTSSSEEVDWWNARFASGEHDMGAETLPICATLPRDPGRAYEVDGDGIDIFGREVHANTLGVVTVDDPTMRPPTTAEVRGQFDSVAVVTTRSLPDGMVRFSTRTITSGDDDLGCSRTSEVTRGISSTTSRVLPVGVFDPEYTALHIARISIPPGAQMIVCAEVFPTDNPLRATATDRVLLSAPTQERPRIVLQAIRRLGRSTIAPGLQIGASVAPSGGTDGCAQRRYWSSEPIPPGPAVSVEQVLWECSTTPIPVDPSGAVTVPVGVTRSVEVAGSWEQRTAEVAIPLQLERCDDPAGCARPREWYEVPIPSLDSRLCGTGAGSGCRDELPPDGIAVIRVDYPVVPGPTFAPAGAGAVTLLDQIDAATPGGDLQVRVNDVTFEHGTDVFHQTGLVRIHADRPVTVEVRVEEADGSGCFTPTAVVADRPAAEHTVEVPAMCSGGLYEISFTATDDAGRRVEAGSGRIWGAPRVAAEFATTVELLGGPGVPEYGYFYRFAVSLDGQNPYGVWWTWSGRQGTSSSCRALAGTTATSSRIFDPIVLRPPTLDVDVRVHITTTGEGDCSGRPSTALGELALEGSFTVEQLLAGTPLVLETEPGAPLPMRVTLTPRTPWRPFTP